MTKEYIAKKILSALFVLLCVIVLNFFLFRLMPGDAVSTIIDPNFSQEAKEHLRHLYALDKTLPEQFLVYIKSMVTFDFGMSFLSQKPVWEEIHSRLLNTLFLSCSVMICSAITGIILGIKAAYSRGGKTEKFVLRSAALTSAFPSFFVELLFLMFFAYGLGFFPLRGTTSIPEPVGAFNICIDYIWHMALPVISLSLLSFGSWALYVRNLTIKTTQEDFVFAARARGLSEKAISHHIFRTILPTIITIILMSLPGLVSGAVITETIFSLRGLGTFLLESVTAQDYPSAQASFFLLALITITSNMLADIFICIADPRIKAEN